MLIPPLLVLSAVGAVLLYVKLAPRPNPQIVLAKATEEPGSSTDDPAPSVPTIPSPIVPAPEPPAATGTAPTPASIEAVVPVPTPPIEVVEPGKPPELQTEPPPLPRVQGVGFDPKALEADRQVEAPADASLTPAARDNRPDDVDKPREVDPDLLPPDPRLARARQRQRRLDALKRLDEERVRFHADLKAICLKFREDSGPEILALSKKYNLKIDPQAEEKAAELLGKNGKFVGADRRTRIVLLRSLGYPEPIILDDIYTSFEKSKIKERDGPRSPAEAYYYSALFLLRNPPAASSRSISSTGPAPAAGIIPPASTPGNGAGSAR